MDTKSQRPKEGEGVISTLNAAIEDLSLAKKVSSITPARVIFDSVGSLLAMIRVCLLLFCDGTLQVHTQPGLYG